MNWWCPQSTVQYFPIVLPSKTQVPKKKKRPIGLNFSCWVKWGEKDKEAESVVNMGISLMAVAVLYVGKEAMVLGRRVG